jgi:hypothetical protein
MGNEKEYGKLSEDQFKRLIKKLPEFRAEESELKALIKTTPKEKLDKILAGSRCWAYVYEFPFVQHLSVVIWAMGKQDWLAKVAAAEDPQEELLRSMDEDPGEWTGPEGGELTIADLIHLVGTLQRTVLSVMLYKRSLSAIMEDVRTGSDDALFDIVRVDRSAVACPTIAARIASAEFLGDKRFFLHLRNALKGPRQKHWEAYKDLRYSLLVLREMGFDRLSDDRLEHLLVHVLKVYPDNPSARKNLRRQYYESKKFKSL